jgi:hypothetical protein
MHCGCPGATGRSKDNLRAGTASPRALNGLVPRGVPPAPHPSSIRRYPISVSEFSLMFMLGVRNCDCMRPEPEDDGSSIVEFRTGRIKRQTEGQAKPCDGNRRLLRAPRERPSGRRAADKRDELAAADHSITSSASASSRSGTSMPSALAVLRLITNSNFVDCWTGKSAGLSPLRMRPAYMPPRRYASVMLVP